MTGQIRLIGVAVGFRFHDETAEATAVNQPYQPLTQQLRGDYLRRPSEKFLI
jgi:hypothetical protein